MFAYTPDPHRSNSRTASTPAPGPELVSCTARTPASRRRTSSSARRSSAGRACSCRSLVLRVDRLETFAVPAHPVTQVDDLAAPCAGSTISAPARSPMRTGPLQGLASLLPLRCRITPQTAQWGQRTTSFGSAQRCDCTVGPFWEAKFRAMCSRASACSTSTGPAGARGCRCSCMCSSSLGCGRQRALAGS